LAGDHKVMREGLRLVLGREASMEVVGEADDGVQAIELTRELRPDAVVMDLSIPGRVSPRNWCAGSGEWRLVKRMF
jgi:DNA-binding NarL/FixJ family response regulator